MKTALFIHSYAAANAMVARHWEFYKRSGWDIFGVGRENSHCSWPEPVQFKNIGLDAYIGGDNLPRRLVDTFRWFLSDPMFKDYATACVIEPDGIFIGNAGTWPTFAGAQHAGHAVPPMKAQKFYHCPWWLHRAAAVDFVRHGDELLAAGDFEQGHPDFFFGYVWQTLGINVEHLAGTYSRNSLDNPMDQQQVQFRIRNGEVWFVHGVKTKAQLDFILS